jgi:hypothetical protein
LFFDFKSFLIEIKHVLLDEIQKCKLWCTPLYGETNVVSFGMNVVDGTKCDRYTDDICVTGVCQKAGCDNVLGSDTKYDNCYVCGGDNSTCRLVRREVSVPMHYGMLFF